MATKSCLREQQRISEAFQQHHKDKYRFVYFPAEWDEYSLGQFFVYFPAEWDEYSLGQFFVVEIVTAIYEISDNLNAK